MEVSACICGSGKSRQISAVRSGSLQVDLYLPRLWAASRIKDFIWPDCESEVRSAAGRAASEHWLDEYMRLNVRCVKSVVKG